ncbi:hypothetical protein [Amycolatopsis pigmentata]|uniref:Uncharacterized protein n=1 Tax=Amycolatopsis pigmentata TaxID=450801 RepID=A0ABW5G340_9PSEU
MIFKAIDWKLSGKEFPNLSSSGGWGLPGPNSYSIEWTTKNWHPA